MRYLDPVLRSTLAGLLLLVACRSEPPLRFFVTFEQARGLEAGDAVRYKGLEIGRVLDVGIDQNGKVRAAVLVRAKYRGAMAQNSVVEIEHAGVFGRRLTVREGRGERQPLEEGGVLVGSEGQVADLLDRLKAASSKALESAGDMASNLKDQLRDLRGSKEAEDLAAAIERLRQESADGAEKLRTEGVAAARERLEALRKSMQASDQEESAELLDKLDRWLGQLEDEVQAEAPPAPGEQPTDPRSSDGDSRRAE